MVDNLAWGIQTAYVANIDGCRLGRVGRSRPMAALAPNARDHARSFWCSRCPGGVAAEQRRKQHGNDCTLHKRSTMRRTSFNVCIASFAGTYSIATNPRKPESRIARNTFG